MLGQIDTTKRNVDHLDLCYFHRTNSGWVVDTEGDTLLGGPFEYYWDALLWALEKEFVEPKHCGYVDEFCD